jgi:hypothetical protein
MVGRAVGPRSWSNDAIRTSIERDQGSGA